MVLSMLMPQIHGSFIITANLGKGDSPWEEEMTTDEDGESKRGEDSDNGEVSGFRDTQFQTIWRKGIEIEGWPKMCTQAS